MSHFKSIFQSERNVEICNSCETIGPLDFEITEEELKMASAILKPNKVPGVDTVTNEMVTYILIIYPIIIL